jgi:hypothetical protein
MKHFTLSEANDVLGQVRPLAEELVERRSELATIETRAGEIRRSVAGNGGGLDAALVERLDRRRAVVAEELRRCVEEINALGVQVKDLALGLLDFPARHPDDARTVLLCWRVGEDEIAFWHGVDEGFAGRKPLPF